MEMLKCNLGYATEQNYGGIAHFRLYHSCSWVEVLIDDRLPYIDGQPVGVHCHVRGTAAKEQFWPQLLHKAIAKYALSRNCSMQSIFSTL